MILKTFMEREAEELLCINNAPVWILAWNVETHYCQERQLLPDFLERGVRFYKPGICSPTFFFFWSNIVTKHFHLVQNVCFLLSGEFSFPLFIYFTFYPLVHFLIMDVCVRGCQRVCAPVRIGECQVQMSVFGVTLYYSFKLSFITFLYLCVMGT